MGLSAVSKRIFRNIAVALSLLLFTSASAAETAYVTDQLRLGIHEASDTSDAAFASLLSGEKVDVLQENIYYAQVKMQDGRTGWVRKNYLVKDPPAVAIVDDLTTERDDLAATAKRLQTEVIDAKTMLKELQAGLESDSVEARTEGAELRGLQKENNALAQRLETYDSSLPTLWAAALAILTLLIGVWLGWWLTDYRSRRRHGGFRI